MQRDIAVATRSFRVTSDEDKVAHIVFGPAGAMPVTDAAGHAALGTIWSELVSAVNGTCCCVKP